jgi:hypothetical protein
MTKTLDVLVMETRGHYADTSVAELEQAGHRVHRCFGPEDKGFPCRGVTAPDACPVDQGVDVALVVRPRVVPQATPLESGVSCALRAGVPVVEQGQGTLDPFESWITRRVDEGGLVAACEEAVLTGWSALRDRIERRATRLLAGTAWEGPIGCAVERDGRRLKVRLSGPPLDEAVVHALSVRALDAVRAEGHRHQEIDVTYAPVTEEGGGTHDPDPPATPGT